MIILTSMKRQTANQGYLSRTNGKTRTNIIESFISPSLCNSQDKSPVFIQVHHNLLTIH